ncbi:MAG: DUF454 family protein [Alphaproteobacteria bacterium]|nr:DUF454 family protein [Alphaproteobacteria bacterium]
MGEDYLGQLRLQKCNDGPPPGWAVCDGAAVEIGAHAALFSLIGLAFGGDGLRTFRLPDLVSPAGTAQAPDRIDAGYGKAFGIEPGAAIERHASFSAVDGHGVRRIVPTADVARHVLPAAEPGATDLLPCICLSGLFPTRAPDDGGDTGVLAAAPGDGAADHPGQIRLQDCTDGVPVGWRRCDGALLPIGGNAALFALFGPTFGGDGVVTFALPDLRSTPSADGDAAIELRSPIPATSGSEIVAIDAEGRSRRIAPAEIVSLVLPARGGGPGEPCIYLGIPDAPVPPARPGKPRPGLRRALWLGLGYAAVALGVIGIFLPLLPTVPFMILAAFAFANSSPALEARLLANPRFGPHIRAWRERGAISRRGKAMALTALAASAILGLVLLDGWLMLVPLAVALISGGWIATRPS